MAGMFLKLTSRKSEQYFGHIMARKIHVAELIMVIFCLILDQYTQLIISYSVSSLKQLLQSTDRHFASFKNIILNASQLVFAPNDACLAAK